MSKFTKKKNTFPIRYKRYVQKSIFHNTTSTIQDRKKRDALNHDINHHILNYENVNQTIIGSYLFTLLHDSLKTPEKYRAERINILKEIYQYLEQNKAWYDLWKTVTLVEEHVYKKNGFINHQVSTELNDMFRSNFSYPNFIVGLVDKQTPIVQKPPFYVTEKLLNFLENEGSIGRKKGRELFNIQTLTIEFTTYLALSYGLYSNENMDLLAQNGIGNHIVSKIAFPRKLTDPDTFIDFIEMNRYFTMNPNGVVIDCYNCGDIEQVILFEQEGYLLWKVIFKQKGVKLNPKGELVEDVNGAEYCGYFSPSFFPRSTFSIHTSFIDFEESVYAFVLECYADIVCGASIINKEFKRNVLNMGAIEMHDSHHIQDNKKMGLRFIPRKTHNKIKEKVNTKVTYDKEIKKYFITGHIRRLPEGYTPSEKALSHAQEFGIELANGYTFVRPYESGEEKIRSHYMKKL
ncbi:hypothetical protein [Cytobacillus horneckiae]|uniref:hypothetical protein n=1 Tax=Cytobacillus horneckiae TaxID=549687 RepID=UPI003D1EA801